MKLLKIGSIGVDSGHLVFIDPAMASLLHSYGEGYTEENQGYKEIEFPSAVSVHTGGDGDFDVYALIDSKETLGWFVCWNGEMDLKKLLKERLEVNGND